MSESAAATGVSGRLGTFVAETARVPDPLRHQGKRALVNGFGTALRSASDPVVGAAAAAMLALSGEGAATVIGRAERLRPADAAFVNAVAMNLLDFDDTHLPTIIHPTSPVAPAALALGEELGASGADVLDAFVLGAEIACRIGNMVSPGHYARGWHITSTCGIFGAAAAAARLLGLDACRTGHALGVASSLSSGHVENLPSAGKNASVGGAARNGILAAQLARNGYVPAPRALEGRLGWAKASGDEPRTEAATRALGDEWEFALNAYKPYPCGIVFHAVVDACLDLRTAHGVTPDEIAGVVVKGDPLFLARGDRQVATAGDARVSLHHTAAVALLFGRAGAEEFEPPCVFAPETIAFREKVRGVLDDGLPNGAATVELSLNDGRTLLRTVTHARGSIERPMSDMEIEAKTRSLARPGSASDVDGLIEALWRMEKLADLAPVMRAAGGR